MACAADIILSFKYPTGLKRMSLSEVESAMLLMVIHVFVVGTSCLNFHHTLLARSVHC